MPKAEARRAGDDIADEEDRGERGAHFHHEHHRVLHQRNRVQLPEGCLDGAAHDLGIEQRPRPRQLLGKQRSRIVLLRRVR